MAFFSMTSIDECGNEDGPLASKACSAACKPAACKVVSACPAGSIIAFGSNGSMPAEAVQGLVQELKSEHSNCPCEGAAVAMKLELGRVQLLQSTGSNLRGSIPANPAAPSACEMAFFSMTSIDECGNEDGPLASKACSAACKPAACKVVSACPAGSIIAFGSNGSMPAEAVQGLVQELKSEHINCPC